MNSPSGQPPRALLYILHSGNLYGTERMALATLAGLDEYDKRVVFAPQPGGEGSVAVSAREAGYESVLFHTRWDLVKGLLPWFRRYREVDVIGTGVSQALTCHLLAKLMRVRIRQLQVAHGGIEDEGAYGRKHHLNAIPVRHVAVSNFVKTKLIQHGVKADSVCVIDNFLSDAQSSNHTRRPPYDDRRSSARPLDPNCVRVVVVSRADPIKRLDLLLDVLQLDPLPGFRFDVFGSGSDLETLKQCSAGMPNVTFHGFVDNVPERLSSADFLLHLCPVEPFGLVILEAFRSKLIPIVPDSGGAGDLVDQGRTGLKFKADRVADLHKALKEAQGLSGPQLERMVEAGTKELQTRFSQANGIRAYRQALVDSVLGVQRRRHNEAPQ